MHDSAKAALADSSNSLGGVCEDVRSGVIMPSSGRLVMLVFFEPWLGLTGAESRALSESYGSVSYGVCSDGFVAP